MLVKGRQMIVMEKGNKEMKVTNNFEFLKYTEVISTYQFYSFTTSILNFEIKTILSTQLSLHSLGHLIVIIKGQHLFQIIQR